MEQKITATSTLPWCALAFFSSPPSPSSYIPNACPTFSAHFLNPYHLPFFQSEYFHQFIQALKEVDVTKPSFLLAAAVIFFQPTWWNIVCMLSEEGDGVGEVKAL